MELFNEFTKQTEKRKDPEEIIITHKPNPAFSLKPPNNLKNVNISKIKELLKAVNNI